MNATKSQKQIIHVTAPTRDIKEELVQWACDDNDKISCNDLTFDQANAILVKLGCKPHWAYKNPEHMQYAKFDKNNEQHKRVLSALMTLGWTTSHPKWGRTADLDRFGKWLMSDKSPVRKPLMKMVTTEVTTIINALDSMTSKHFKK